jgi:hypothetical protein
MGKLHIYRTYSVNGIEHEKMLTTLTERSNILTKLASENKLMGFKDTGRPKDSYKVGIELILIYEG